MEDSLTGSELARQVETYSNAIVGFVVLQSLAYSYSFGTNQMFNCLVKTARFLAAGLTTHFVISTVLLLFAMAYLGRIIQAVAGSYVAIIRRIYLGKMLAVVLFSVVPIAVTVCYGLVPSERTKYDCPRPGPHSPP